MRKRYSEKNMQDKCVKQQNSIRKDEYTVLKTLAVLLVVIAHVTIFFSSTGGIVPMKTNMLLDYITKLIYSFHMQLFFFLSGAIFKCCIENGKYKEIKPFILSKTKRLMFPYFMWGCCYVAPIVTLLKVTKVSFGEYLVNGILCNGDSRHLWYLWALFFIFLLARMLVPVLEKGNYIQIAAAVAATVLSYYAFDLPPAFGISRVLRYLQYFLWGYAFVGQKKWVDALLRGRGYLAFVMFVIMSVFVIKTDNYNINFLLPYAGIFTCYVFVLNVKEGLVKSRAYQIVQQNSMGIYLVHPMIVYVLFFLYEKYIGNVGWALLVCICVFAVTMLLSVGIAKVIKKLHWNVLFGE